MTALPVPVVYVGLVGPFAWIHTAPDGGEVAEERYDTVTTDDGWVLGVTVQPALTTHRGVALLLHAMMADHRSMERHGAGLAMELRVAGWDVHLADFRGHGNSGPPAARGTDWTYDDLVLRDVPALVEHARRSPGPVWVVGHSLGGHVTAASLGTGVTAVDGLVMIAANIWTRTAEPSRYRRLLKAVSVAAFAGLAQLAGRFPARALGVGPCDESASYAWDLARYHLRDRWTSRDGIYDYSAGLGAISCPVLSVTSHGDRLYGRPEAVRRWAEGIPNLEHLVVGDAHGPTHMELVTDMAQRGLWQDIAGWMGMQR